MKQQNQRRNTFLWFVVFMEILNLDNDFIINQNLIILEPKPILPKVHIFWFSFQIQAYFFLQKYKWTVQCQTLSLNDFFLLVHLVIYRKMHTVHYIDLQVVSDIQENTYCSLYLSASGIYFMKIKQHQQQHTCNCTIPCAILSIHAKDFQKVFYQLKSLVAQKHFNHLHETYILCLQSYTCKLTSLDQSNM